MSLYWHDPCFHAGAISHQVCVAPRWNTRLFSKLLLPNLALRYGLHSYCERVHLSSVSVPFDIRKQVLQISHVPPHLPQPPFQKKKIWKVITLYERAHGGAGDGCIRTLTVDGCIRTLDGCIRTLTVDGCITTLTVDGCITTLTVDGCIRTLTVDGCIRTLTVDGCIRTLTDR